MTFSSFGKKRFSLLIEQTATFYDCTDGKREVMEEIRKYKGLFTLSESCSESEQDRGTNSNDLNTA